jgi:hypothetical protein
MIGPPAFDGHEAATHEHVVWVARIGLRRVNGKYLMRKCRRAGIVMGHLEDGKGNLTGDLSIATYDGRILHKHRSEVRTIRGRGSHTG